MGERVIVIGAPLSGIDALTRLVASLPANFPAPILIYPSGKRRGWR